MPRSRLATLVATLSCVLMLGAVADASAATSTPSHTSLAKTIAVTGKANNGKRLRNGRFTIDRFAKQNGKLYAIGKLSGIVGNRAFSRSVRMPATRPGIAGAQTAQLPPLPSGQSCQILSLDLGPINLNLLGLVVRTNVIQVRIDAVQGPGNLLGNLLCGITGLLDQNALANSPLGQIASILNSLLALVPRTA